MEEVPETVATLLEDESIVSNYFGLTDWSFGEPCRGSQDDKRGSQALGLRAHRVPKDQSLFLQTDRVV
jgi:hypothetical protein